MYSDSLEWHNNICNIIHKKNNTTAHVDIEDNIWEDTDCTRLSEWKFLYAE